MSHTTAISSIKITDTNALRAAVNELKSQGVRCDLLENAIPRAYSRGQMGQADYVLNLKDSRYDVGFYKAKDKTEYEARCDFWNHEVEDLLGAPAGEGENADQARMGKLFQLYAAHAATNVATRQGYAVQRVNQPNGTIQLVVTGV